MGRCVMGARTSERPTIRCTFGADSSQVPICSTLSTPDTINSADQSLWEHSECTWNFERMARETTMKRLHWLRWLLALSFVTIPAVIMGQNSGAPTSAQNLYVEAFEGCNAANS